MSLVTGSHRRVDSERSLTELAGLAESAGAIVVLRVMQDRPKPDPATYIGSGKAAALAAACAEAGVDLVVFDNELTPAQLRQLEDRLDGKVVILNWAAHKSRARGYQRFVESFRLKAAG